MGARVYVPSLGAFLQPDPVPGGGPNDYGYSGGNPVTILDLLGTRLWTLYAITRTVTVAGQRYTYASYIGVTSRKPYTIRVGEHSPTRYSPANGNGRDILAENIPDDKVKLAEQGALEDFGTYRIMPGVSNMRMEVGSAAGAGTNQSVFRAYTDLVLHNNPHFGTVQSLLDGRDVAALAGDPVAQASVAEAGIYESGAAGDVVGEFGGEEGGGPP
jgi:hypothetical protein